MNGILFPMQIENIQTRKDNTIKVVIGTQELSEGKAGKLFSMLNKFGYAHLSPAEISQKELDEVDQLDPEMEGKTQGQRIRNVLYILFTQDPEGFTDFDAYYKNKTEKFINHLKTKIK